MPQTSFADRIKADPPPIGTVVTIENPIIAEALALAGMDWLFIDMEHGALDIGAVQLLVSATPAGCHTMVRVPENRAIWIKRVLDTGCDGVIVPQVNTGPEARAAVAAAKYPPVGRRSVGVGRAHGYGLSFRDYLERANLETSVVLQIEDALALEHLEDIVTTPGIAGILLGPYDLSGSLGHPGDVAHPTVQGAITIIRDTCKRHNLPVGAFLLDPTQIRRELDSGVSFLAVGTDVSYLTRTAIEVQGLLRA